jgi:hypothetical protein
LSKISQSHDREHRLYIGSQAQADRDQNDHAASKPIKIWPKKATTTCSAPSKKTFSSIERLRNAQRLMKIRSPKIGEVKVEPLHEQLLKAAVPRAVQLKQNSAGEITNGRAGGERDLCHSLLTNLI